jgi:hypothetical protein
MPAAGEEALALMKMLRLWLAAAMGASQHFPHPLPTRYSAEHHQQHYRPLQQTLSVAPSSSVGHAWQQCRLLSAAALLAGCTKAI